MKYLLYMTFLFHFTYTTKWFGTLLQYDGIKVWKIDHPALSVKDLDFGLNQNIQSDCKFSKNSFIVHKAVEIDGVLTHTIYYLFGKFKNDSEILEKKAKIFTLIIELWEEFQKHSIDVSIVKETCDRESEEFLSIFAESSNAGKSKNRLYRVTVYMGKTIIVQVPPLFSELSKEDIFVLDSHYGVYSFRTTDNKEDTKFAVWKELVKFIEKHDYEERKKFFNIMDGSKSSRRNVDRFMFYLKGSANAIDKIESFKKFEDIHQLYEISEGENEIPIEMLFHFASAIKDNKCYLLVKHTVKEVFIHIGKSVNALNRKKCLMYAEEHEHHGYLVSTVYGDRLLPFVIIFHEIFRKTTDTNNYKQVNFDLIEGALFPKHNIINLNF